MFRKKERSKISAIHLDNVSGLLGIMKLKKRMKGFMKVFSCGLGVLKQRRVVEWQKGKDRECSRNSPAGGAR